MPLQKNNFFLSLVTLIIFLVVITVLYYIFNTEVHSNQVANSAQITYSNHKDSGAVSSLDSVTILMYHEFTEDKDFIKNPFVLPFSMFKEQMRYLKDHQYTTLSLDELYQFIECKTPIPKKSVVITFDDGYRNVFRLVYPLFKEYNFSAAAFIIVNSLAPNIELAEKTNRITSNEIVAMQDVFNIGSHTYNMHNSTNGKSMLLTESLGAVFRDLCTSKNLLNTSYFAYPYGQYNTDVMKQVKDAGFKLAFTTRPGKVYNHCNHYDLPRFNVSPTITIDKFAKMVSNTNSIQ